jgi:hypothetical protein
MATEAALALDFLVIPFRTLHFVFGSDPVSVSDFLGTRALESYPKSRGKIGNGRVGTSPAFSQPQSTTAILMNKYLSSFDRYYIAYAERLSCAHTSLLRTKCRPGPLGMTS